MAKIHQALWGYSSGHDLLASSTPLSNQSLKILGPLSDLSGPAVPKGFDGYLTGCFLPAENFYALSKTWYAPEMPRLGCVWTHTLLLDCNSSTEINQIDLESLFQRPNALKRTWKNFYMMPIEIDGACKSELTPSDIQKTAYCLLSILTRHAEPVVAVAEDNATLNAALVYMLCDMGLNFFRDLTFCTGSFSNREVQKVPLDLQIVPSSVTRASFRSNRSKMFFLDISQYLCPHNLHAASVAKRKSPQIRNFVQSCGTQYYNYKNWFAFEQIYDLLIHLDKFSITQILCLLEKNINNKRDVTNIMGKVFERIFLSQPMLPEGPSVLLPVLSDFLSTSDLLFGKDVFASEKVLKKVLDQMWQASRKDMIHFLPNLIGRGLNATGEKAVQYCAMLLTPSDFSLLLCQSPYLCALFLRLNWRLALCKDIWRQSKSVQTESLHELRKIMASKNIIPDECTDILKGLYQTSQYCFAKDVYEMFGNISIESFFGCVESFKMETGSTVLQWCDVCAYNQSFSIQKLKCVHDPAIFQAVISVIDPYQETMLTEPADLWADLYQRFCLNTTSEDLKRTYAQFILPIILRSNEIFPNECVEFAFLTVHKILMENDMEPSKWEKVSEFLPKVEWFNEWDKCKRLRMAAENRGNKFDFDVN